ncbi:hypothetical protein ACIRFH_30840 [Streptomyces sp. NPDC093586]|uniref:hypothetical protein n=1 Tax=Streptomyces sp. NPDC093586 TaxID=3366042 RepID=UPI0037FD5060
MAEWNWGTVPTWVSAILTSGSLLLGFYILLRDRRKEERQEALKVICWSEMVDNESYKIYVLNTAERPVVHARMLVRLAGDVLEPVGLGAGAIRPGEEVTARSPRHLGGEKSWPAAVEFQDADGIDWVRDLRSGALHRRKGEPGLLRLLFQRRGWKSIAYEMAYRRQLRRG